MDKWTKVPLNILYKHARNLSEYEKLIKNEDIPFMRRILTKKGIKKKSDNFLLNEKTNINLFGRLYKKNYEYNFSEDETNDTHWEGEEDSFSKLNILNKENENINGIIDKNWDSVKGMNYVYDNESFCCSDYVYNWELGKQSLIKMLDFSYNFCVYGMNYDLWELIRIPTNNYVEGGSRVQKMYETVISSQHGNEIRLFIKKIPINAWVNQYKLMKEYEGEYIVNAENYVMEVVALSFLNEYYPGIAPNLYRVLFEPDVDYTGKKFPQEDIFQDLDTFNLVLENELKSNMNGYIVMVSEYFGENISEYIKRQRKKIFSIGREKKKKKLLYDCLNLLRKLHSAGLSHLDFTSQNILISDNHEIRLCDFGKATPMYTFNLRHINNINGIYPFESCVPYVGKVRFIPPECWDLIKKQEELHITYPFEYLKSITDEEERKTFYFNVSSVDKYMLGILFIWIWNYNFLWKRSDPSYDDKYLKFTQYGMNLDFFKETKRWPKELKNIIKQLIHIDYRKNLNLNDLSKNPWWSSNI
ncbi:serine/threonine protein kinase, FIKK family [Plasmodium sp. DRC-Itaito]|nr:serine/threonine protein kinase, FIKK family [Plasmodium sp. DRC-Itaito]